MSPFVIVNANDPDIDNNAIGPRASRGNARSGRHRRTAVRDMAGLL